MPLKKGIIQGFSSDEQEIYDFCLNKHSRILKSNIESKYVQSILTLYNMMYLKMKRLWQINSQQTCITESTFEINKIDQMVKRDLLENSRKVRKITQKLCQNFSFILSRRTRLNYLRIVSTNRSHKAEFQSELSDSPHSRGRNLEKSASRIKIKVDRNEILKYGIKAMEARGTTTAKLEYDFADEKGSGIGPTLEFYSLSAAALQELHTLWRNTADYLFPSPLDPDNLPPNFNNTCSIFKYMGWLIARAISDSRLLDLPLAETFWELVLGSTLNLTDIKRIDKNIGNFLIALEELAKKKALIENTTGLGPEEKRSKFLN